MMTHEENGNTISLSLKFLVVSVQFIDSPYIERSVYLSSFEGFQSRLVRFIVAYIFLAMINKLDDTRGQQFMGPCQFASIKTIKKMSAFKAGETEISC